MSRIICAMQYPIKLRYSDWWFSEFPKQFEKYYDEVIVLGRKFIENQDIVLSDEGLFSSSIQSIQFEQKQIKEFLSLPLREDDTLFLSDLSYPGFFSNVLYHKKPNKCFVFCHATSKNRGDIFEGVRESKWLVEKGHSLMFDKIFVGTDYHKIKLGILNVVKTALPNPPLEIFNLEKENNIVSAARLNPQKINYDLEEKVEKKYGKILRQDSNSWKDYYEFLSKSKVLIISSYEETYGYQIVDAILNNCIPIAPKKFSYIELLTREYLYDNEEELFSILDIALNGKLEVPRELLCQYLVDNFYKNICEIMKGEIK